MDPRRYRLVNFALIGLLLASGCHPAQPFFLNEDGDLSHYLDQATEIEYPDTDEPSLPDATMAQQPYSLTNTKPIQFWDLTLEEAETISLQNSKVIRTLGGRLSLPGSQVGQSAQFGPPLSVSQDVFQSVPSSQFSTIYDTAIAEADPGQGPGATGAPGVEAALAAFDTQWNTRVFWDRTDRPQNVSTAGDGIFARILQQDQMNFQSEFTKRAVTGTQWSFRNVSTYDSNNRPLRALTSEWLTSWEAEARHPLMRGGGVAVNRVNIMVARTRADIRLAQFSISIRNHLLEVENTYWDLFFYYKNFETAKVARDSAQGTWKRISAIYEKGGPGVSGEQEAQSKEQYFFFRGRVEEAKRDLLIAERQLRYLMGISPTDGRIVRPVDNPTLAKVQFEWSDILAESLTRSDEVRQRKWKIKQDELELIAARNNLLPQVDLVALYRWLGMGDDLVRGNRRGLNFPAPGSMAFDELTEGNFQEWRLGVDVNVPLGARLAHTGVRSLQLQLSRDRAILEDLELEISHGLSDAVQRMDANYALARTSFLQRAAAKRQVDVLQSKVEAGTITLDQLLDAQRRAADAERSFYQALLQYNRAIIDVHWRKGSLLEYCGVMLQEGPWPAKAYYDALQLARQRDASYYFNYGFSRPSVVSRGKVDQSAEEVLLNDGAAAGMPTGEPTLAPGTPDEPSLDFPAEGGSDESLPPPAESGSPRSALEAPDMAGSVEPASFTTAIEPTTPPANNSKFDWQSAFE